MITVFGSINVDMVARVPALADALRRASVAGGLTTCEAMGVPPSLPSRSAISQALPRLAPAEAM